ncbi:hypothetical protein JOC78_001012 [Bacillus ectoiniformans]|nr:hypothetical protein [Bacillus ectoiniformans]
MIKLREAESYVKDRVGKSANDINLVWEVFKS